MALTENRAEAFDVTRTTSRTRREKERNKRTTFQFNGAMTEALKPHLKYAAAREGKSLGDFVEPILVEYMISCGYITESDAADMNLLRNEKQEA